LRAKSRGQKSWTSPAAWQRYFEASNLLMRRIPLLPAMSDCQKCSFPIPFGAITPIPVITTRRGDRIHVLP
jgi:hypothetical protein